jgi:hypothetical protein
MSNFKNDDSKDLSLLLKQLIESYNSMMGNIKKINGIMNQTNLLSLNSSIEAARAGEAGKGFAVIAQEIQKFSEESKIANQESLKTMNDLSNQINSVIGVRTADVAFDLIDKIDRNLFERNCDVQAWATFERVVAFALDPTEENKKGTIDLLKNIHEIYEVYYDIVMADKNGIIVANAVRPDLIGKDVSDKDWFKNASSKSGSQVSDMYYSDDYTGHTVSYSCGIRDTSGKTVGVLSTRFNWSFIYDILDKAKIGPKGEVYAVNSTGIVIASRNKSEVLRRNLADTYGCVRKVISGEEYGYEIETSNNNLEGIIGYAHTQGYNAYAGKNWSVVVKETF